MRQRLSGRPFFNLHDAFKSLDFDENGFITKEEMRTLLRNHGFFATETELTSLVDRFDKNKDGRISYSEFIQEVTPHSPLKH